MSKSFRTLYEEKSARNIWYPTGINIYKNAMKLSSENTDIRRLKSNFAYSMQYIEYIEKQLDELKLSSVLQKMLYKSYIITAMSVIELLFTNLLHETGNWNTTDWKEFSEIISNPKEVDGKTVKVETHLFHKVDTYEMRMDLDSMIKKIEKKNLITIINHSDFPAMKKLRELRNRVHLQIGEGAYDHDYNCFGLEQIQMMRRLLYTILTCPQFCAYDRCFEFIKISYIKNGGIM